MNTPQNIEWLDWNGELNTGRRLNWSPPNAIKIAPQLCLNSKEVQNSVKSRAILIGSEIAKGVQELRKAGKNDLFVGVIAGWETQIGKDFGTREILGYCALTNAGYSEKNPPRDTDAAPSAKSFATSLETWVKRDHGRRAVRQNIFTYRARVRKISLVGILRFLYSRDVYVPLSWTVGRTGIKNSLSMEIRLGLHAKGQPWIPATLRRGDLE